MIYDFEDQLDEIRIQLAKQYAGKTREAMLDEMNARGRKCAAEHNIKMVFDKRVKREK